MTATLIGYARCSTAEQDLTAQRQALETMGVDPRRVYVDQGATGTHRDRPGLREALAATRSGDTLVVTKLDRLARSIRDARDIVDELTTHGVRLQIGGTVHDPNDPVGRLLLNVLAMVAEFEADLIRAPHPRRHGHREGKGQAQGPQAQAHSCPGASPRRPPPRRQPHLRRDRRALRGLPRDRLPRRRTCSTSGSTLGRGLASIHVETS